MSISIYYEAKRVAPVSPAEKQALDGILEKFSVDQAIEKYIETGEGINWESFAFYDEPFAPGTILCGSTKLPDNTEEAVWTGLQHWSAALTEIRRLMDGATWDVRIEDHKLHWDEGSRAYDPAK